MKVCGVIVTYGDRFSLLSQVIDALLKEEVEKIVIIDNGSSMQTQAGLKKYSSHLIIHSFEENKGTAIAFKTGIQKAIKAGFDFIWLLDDDTMPGSGSLNKLKDFWKNIFKPGKENNTALCSYRIGRANFVKAVTSNDPDEILPLKNNYAGFHIKSLFTKIRERLSAKTNKFTELPPTAVRISAASYGGLFFHKDLIEKIGLPDESYFLYVDDFDFTYRITRSPGEIWLITSSIIHDLESSFYLPAKKKLLYHSAFDSVKDSSSYYALRNTVYFSKKYLIDNKTVYFLNKLSFNIFITIIGILRGKIKRLKVIKSAMKDGEKGQLGISPNYTV